MTGALRRPGHSRFIPRATGATMRRMRLAQGIPVLVLVLAAAAAGCSRQPRVTSTATPGTDFGKYRTYAIKPGNVAYPGAPPEQRDAIAHRIQDALAAEL